ncbi:hypothetical protein [Ruminococcus sp. FC2018]|uniref:hypothetical protein n=1 Tax=Ruminococcus sp. FC2018 TaxID=1410617 RepID=UPI00048FE7A8|nr:hypothetical protein [Ruminococcus sp. FC2018]
MTLTIKCECGNEVTMSAPKKKYIQFRDYLDTKRFRFSDDEYDKESKIKEIKILCDECGNYVSLGFD